MSRQVDSFDPPEANPEVRPARRGRPPQGPAGFVWSSVRMGWRWLTRMKTALLLLAALGVLTHGGHGGPAGTQRPQHGAGVAGRDRGAGTGRVRPARRPRRLRHVRGADLPRPADAAVPVVDGLPAAPHPGLVEADAAGSAPGDPPPRPAPAPGLVHDLADPDRGRGRGPARARPSPVPPRAPLDDRRVAERTAAATTWTSRRDRDATWRPRRASCPARVARWPSTCPSTCCCSRWCSASSWGSRARSASSRARRFTDTQLAYWGTTPGRWWSPDDHPGFTMHLDQFDIDWVRDPRFAGTPSLFQSEVTITQPDGSSFQDTVGGNDPLVVDGMKIHQLEWGYAPRMVVEVDGEVVYDALPDRQPDQRRVLPHRRQGRPSRPGRRAGALAVPHGRQRRGPGHHGPRPAVGGRPAAGGRPVPRRPAPGQGPERQPRSTPPGSS